MKLAESVAEHCRNQPAEGAYSALAGKTWSLSDILAPYVGRRTPMGGGQLFIPVGCTWKAKDQEDGAVQLSFDAALPVFYTSQGPEMFAPEVTTVVLRLGADGLRAEFHGRVLFVPLPAPYPLSVTFN